MVSQSAAQRSSEDGRDTEGVEAVVAKCGGLVRIPAFAPASSASSRGGFLLLLRLSGVGWWLGSGCLCASTTSRLIGRAVIWRCSLDCVVLAGLRGAVKWFGALLVLVQGRWLCWYRVWYWRWGVALMQGVGAGTDLGFTITMESMCLMKKVGDIGSYCFWNSWFCVVGSYSMRGTKWLLWSLWWKRRKVVPLYQAVLRTIHPWDPGEGQKLKKRAAEDMETTPEEEEEGGNPFRFQG